MSSTRKAKDPTVFHQNRYASSAEFERGLIANLVAKRVALLDADADRELIWFVQYLSHQTGGLAAVAKDVYARFTDRLATQSMGELKLKPSAICSADQVKAIRREIENSERFPLRGEVENFLHGGYEQVPQQPYASSYDDDGVDTAKKRWCENRAQASKNPESYPAKTFFECCQIAAQKNLESALRELCLNPATDLKAGPWYFPRLIESLREYQAQYIQQQSAGVFTTALGQKVCEVLDYTVYSRGLTLMQGDARLGKSHAARTWCNQHPGQARFVEVPDGNDDASFFRDLARGLGLGNFLNYKVTQLRERVENVLLAGDITLVLDEAQRLFPAYSRAGYPKRIVWVMSMANAGVPICMISTPQFLTSQKSVEKNGWNSAQLTGRISHYEALPADLSAEDLMGVAKTVLPEAENQVLRALAIYARSSARYLAAIEAIAKRARFIAMRAGRATATTADVRTAMQESVIPADAKLHRALENGRASKPEKLTPAPEPVLPIAAARGALTASAEPAPTDLGTSGRRQTNSSLSAPRRSETAPLIEA